MRPLVEVTTDPGPCVLSHSRWASAQQCPWKDRESTGPNTSLPLNEFGKISCFFMRAIAVSRSETIFFCDKFAKQKGVCVRSQCFHGHHVELPRKVAHHQFPKRRIDSVSKPDKI